jgi:hypothetical protein
MKEYIEREALLKNNMYGNTNSIIHRTYAERLIKAMSTVDVDVVEVVHAKWYMNSDFPDTVICTNCDFKADVW